MKPIFYSLKHSIKLVFHASQKKSDDTNIIKMFRIEWWKLIPYAWNQH